MRTVTGRIVGSTIVSIGADGQPRSESPEPNKYDFVRDPRDPQAREWPSLKAFLAAWKKERGELTTAGVEFVAK